MVNVKYQWNSVKNNIFLIENYPGLTFVTPDRIEGKLKFSALYDPATGVILINPSEHPDNNYHIEDSYSVRIDLPDDPQLQFPLVYETEGKILAAGKKRGINNVRDLHIYENGCTCLCPTPQLLERIITGRSENLQMLLDDLVTPYFYQQSYFERYGSWPIKNYSHGFQAIFEYYLREKNKTGKSTPQLLALCSATLKSYAKLESCKNLEALIESKKELKPTSKCFCGSERKYKKCHRRIFSKEAKAGFISFIDDLRNPS